MTLQTTLAAITIISLSLISACSNNPPSNNSGNNAPLSHYTWSLQKIQHKNQVATTQLNSGVAANQVTININGSRLNYNGGCNHGLASVQLSPVGKIKIGGMASTKIACPDRRKMLTDREISSYLKAIKSYEHSGNKLKLTGKKIILSFTGKLKTPPSSVKSTRKFIELKKINNTVVWRQAKYNEQSIQINKQSPWNNTDYRNIENFTPQSGQHYIVRIKEFVDPKTKKIRWVKDMIVMTSTL